MAAFDVFLSHNSIDKTWVVKLKNDLIRYGLRVWLDRDEIRPGDLFAEALEDALGDCGAVALIISPEAMASGWVKEEYYRALSLTKKTQPPVQLIPVILRSAEVPGFVQSRNWIDFRDESKYDESVWRLVWGITGQKPARMIDLAAPLVESSLDGRKVAQETENKTFPISLGIWQKIKGPKWVMLLSAIVMAFLIFLAIRLVDRLSSNGEPIKIPKPLPIGQIAQQWQGGKPSIYLKRPSNLEDEKVLNNISFGPAEGDKRDELAKWCRKMSSCVNCEPKTYDAEFSFAPTVTISLKSDPPLIKEKMWGTWMNPKDLWELVDESGTRYLYRCEEKK